MSHMVGYWFKVILERYIIEFVDKFIVSYSTIEWKFLKGLRGRYTRLFPTTFKIPLCNKVALKMELDTMIKSTPYTQREM